MHQKRWWDGLKKDTTGLFLVMDDRKLGGSLPSRCSELKFPLKWLISKTYHMISANSGRVIRGILRFRELFMTRLFWSCPRLTEILLLIDVGRFYCPSRFFTTFLWMKLEFDWWKIGAIIQQEVVTDFVVTPQLSSTTLQCPGDS